MTCCFGIVVHMGHTKTVTDVDVSLQIGDKVRVKLTAPRHAGKIGYVDLVGEGPSSGTVILCTEKRVGNDPEFKYSAALWFAAYIEDVEKLTINKN